MQKKKKSINVCSTILRHMMVVCLNKKERFLLLIFIAIYTSVYRRLRHSSEIKTVERLPRLMREKFIATTAVGLWCIVTCIIYDPLDITCSYTYRGVGNTSSISIAGAGVWLYLEVKYPQWRLKELASDVKCYARFGKTLSEDIEKIRSYDLSSAIPYLRELDPASSPAVYLRDSDHGPVEVPVLVSGASSNHFEEAKLLISHLNSVVRTVYSNVPFYFFDLGLEAWQIQEINETCNCIFTKFPFDKYPKHLRDLRGFCWKPVLIKTVLQRHRYIMWMDTSARFLTSDLDGVFIQGKQQGVMASLDKHSVASHTHQDTFSFLQETPCLFKNLGEFQGGLILLHTSHRTVYEYLLNPWVSCALIEDCMKTRHYTWWIINCNQHTHYHECHRSDMSVLSILIYRLFHRSYRNHAIFKFYFYFDKLPRNI